MPIHLPGPVPNVRNKVARFVQHFEYHARDTHNIELEAGTQIKYFALNLLDRSVHYLVDALAGILYEEPISHRIPRTVNRERLIEQRARDKARDHFFQMLLRT